MDEIGIEPFYTIESLSGYYTMRCEDNCHIDFMDFETLVHKGESTIKTNPKEGISILKKAIDIYKGQYLLELEDEEWTMPLRNRKVCKQPLPILYP